MTITTIAAGIAQTTIYGGIGHITRKTNGKWEARPEWDVFTVGKHFPSFDTRREAAEWLWETYGN